MRQSEDAFRIAPGFLLRDDRAHRLGGHPDNLPNHAEAGAGEPGGEDLAAQPIKRGAMVSGSLLEIGEPARLYGSRPTYHCVQMIDKSGPGVYAASQRECEHAPIEVLRCDTAGRSCGPVSHITVSASRPLSQRRTAR